MPALRRLLPSILFVIAGTALAAQSGRVALVIGNGAYKYNTVLANPANDAADMATALSAAGFDVILKTDAGIDVMNKSLRDFGSKLKEGKGVGLFYYSGHGAQVKGKNYLIPVDQDIQDADEVVYKTLDAEAVLAKMESAGNSLNLVFLDACRNNPFPGSSKSGERGLVVMRVDLPESVIVYAAEPGKTAADGEKGRDSPFTTALLHNMTKPGQDILDLMKKVKAEVSAATNGAQSPRVDQNLSRDFAFYPGTAAKPVTVEPSAVANQPDFGEVKVAPGALSLSFATAGSLELAGRIVEVPAGGSLPVRNLKPGTYPMSLRYADGNIETKNVEVESGLEIQVSFTYRPSPSVSAASSVPDGMVFVPGGSFTMGSPAKEAGRSNDESQHQVTIRDFYIGATEVTQAQYKTVMGLNPSNFKGDELPVESVSWYDAVAYCNMLSKKEGLSPAYSISGTSVSWNKGAKGYRLPTEAEWEFAARGGAAASSSAVKAVYAGSADVNEVAWYFGNSGNLSHPVGQKDPNGAKLYDMAGNVWEWCWDWYGAFSSGKQSDPKGPASGSRRVVRGGSWVSGASSLRSARRYYYDPGLRGESVGFRVLRP